MSLPYTIILPTDYGDMLVNRFDINQTGALLKTAKATDFEKVNFAVQVCKNSPKNSIALDIGANFGTYSLAMAGALVDNGGKVYSFEAQRIIYYMLCGSVSINSIENCYPHFACVGNSNEKVSIPKFNYSAIMNFGSIEFGSDIQQEQLHQLRGSSDEKVQQIKIDDLNLQNVCYSKIDVEGMEIQVLLGALKTLADSRPVLQIEIIKTNPNEIISTLTPLGYKIYSLTGDLICIPSHLSDVYKFS